MMKREAIDLGTWGVPILFKKLFIPTLFGMLSISAVTVADGIFVGRGVGSDGIAAVNICIPMLMIFTGAGLMAGVGSSVVASVHLSRGRIKAARLNITQALWFITIVTLILSASIMCFARQIALALGSSEHLLPLVTDYLLWFVPSLTFQMWITIGLFIIRLDGAPKLAMWCSVLSALINVVLDWLFIFPLHLGVKGAALATSLSILSGGIIVIFYLLFFARRLRVISLKWSRKNMQLSLRNIGYQCRIGSSSLLSEATLAVLMFTGNQVFMHYLGDDGVGAFGIGCYYIPFVFMVGNAIAQSAQPIVSYNFGAGNMDRVAMTGKISVITAVACGAAVTVVFLFFPHILVSFFLTSDNAAARIAVDGLPFFAIGFVFFVVNLAVIGYYQSLERAKSATGFAVLRGFVFLVPCFLLLPELTGPVGIWLSMPLSEILTTAVIVSFYFLRKEYQTGLLQQ